MMHDSALYLLWFIVPSVAVIAVIGGVLALWYAWRRRREAMLAAPSAMPVARVHRRARSRETGGRA